MVPEQRARGIGEVLDAAVALYRARFRTLIGATVAVMVPVQVVSTLVLLSAQPDSFEIGTTGSPTPVYDDSSTALAQLGATAVILVLGLLSAAFVAAVCTRIAADAYVDLTRSIGDAMRLIGRRFFPLIGLTILVTLGQVLGVFACFVGVFVALVFLAVAVPAFVLEQAPVFKSIGRSIELTRSRFWHVLGVVLAAQLLVAVLQFGLTLLVDIAFASGDSTTTLVIMQGVAGAVSAVVTAPLVATATVALYFDLRVRVEAMDVQMLMQRIDEKYARNPPVAPAAR
jgi:hypothetical protein